MTDTCIFCSLLSDPANDPTFVASFKRAAVFLNFDQNTYPGQTLLIAHDHHEHLHLMPTPLRQGLDAHLMTLAAATQKAFAPMRLNYECLGNEVPHVHWHVTPRYPGDRNTGNRPQPDPNVRWGAAAYRAQSNRLRAALGLEPL